MHRFTGHRSSETWPTSQPPDFEENGLQQLQEIIAQHINHPSVVMWGIFSQLWMRGDDVTPYLRKAERYGPGDGPVASDRRVQRPGRCAELHHRPDRLEAERRMETRNNRRRDRLARPVAEELEPSAIGGLLRRSGIPRPQKLHGAGRTPARTGSLKRSRPASTRSMPATCRTIRSSGVSGSRASSITALHGVPTG